VGLFAAALAPRLTGTGRITAVESDPGSAAAARHCLRDLTTVTVVTSDVERALANPRWRAVDLVVLDPPRSGAGRGVVEAIMARRPRAVAYVSCDPAALARDVRAFRQAGARLRVLQAFDLFPMTHHVECVALLCPPAESI
jgi:tRNA/tmRNA/rRNA uracil-C5-methylase (TrmA/RlmC/RlmD family)